MSKTTGLTLGIVLFTAYGRSAPAADPVYKLTPRPTAVATSMLETPTPTEPAMTTAPAATAWHTPPACAAAGACRPTVACRPQKAACDSGCGDSKLRRLWNFLTYWPETRGGVGLCCEGGNPKHPPLYTYFPCIQGCASACGNKCAPADGRTVYYVKQSDGTHDPVQANGVAKGGEEQSSGARPAPERRISTYKPSAIATVMPVLSPGQFRRPPAAAGCAGCQR